MTTTANKLKTKPKIEMAWTMYKDKDRGDVQRCILQGNHKLTSVSGYMDIVPIHDVAARTKRAWECSGALTLMQDSEIICTIPFQLPAFTQQDKLLARIGGEQRLLAWIGKVRGVFDTFGSHISINTSNGAIPVDTKRVITGECKRYILDALIQFWIDTGYSPATKDLFEIVNERYVKESGEARSESYINAQILKLRQAGYIRTSDDPNMLVPAPASIYNAPRLAYLPLYNAEGVPLEMKREVRADQNGWDVTLTPLPLGANKDA